MRAHEQLNQVRPTLWLRWIVMTLCLIKNSLFLFVLMIFSNHFWKPWKLPTPTISGGQGVLHVWLKKNHLLVYDPAAWLVDVLVLVLEETANNNFLFTFSMSFMLLHISFHLLFPGWKVPVYLFVPHMENISCLWLRLSFLKTFLVLLHPSWRWGGEREGKHPKLSPITRMQVYMYFTVGMVCFLFLS